MTRIETAPTRAASGRAADRAYAALRVEILESRWPAGAPLREQELASRLGVSRTPVRDALRRLAADGLVTLVPNAGARINSWDAHDLDEIFGLRALLEAHAAERAAARIAPAALAELSDLCEAMEALVVDGGVSDAGRLTGYNDRFHGLIHAAAGHGRLAKMLKQVVEMPLVLRTFSRYGPADLARSMAHHRELVAALSARDADWAGAVMRAHVRAARAIFDVPSRVP